MNTMNVISELKEIRNKAMMEIPMDEVGSWAKGNGFVNGSIVADYISGRWCFGYIETKDVHEAIQNCKEHCELLHILGIESHPQHFVFVSTERIVPKYWLASMVETTMQ